MCGLTGFLYSGSSSGVDLGEQALRMAERIQHRGPDDAGVWHDDAVGVALAHRRLSIVDLSPAGHQPMLSPTGRYVLVYNGEIYNHEEIRQELATLGNVGSAWRGHSDTETLLAAIEQWGIDQTLQRCVGMFAMALWDKKELTLTLTRDRFGEKPLYYGWAQGAFVFGSELKALRAFPGFAAQICRSALTQYLRFMAVPAPRSIYQGVYKLEPGCMLTVQGRPPTQAPAEPLRPGQSWGNLTIRRWWALADVVTKAAQNPFTNDADAVSQLETCLSEAVRMQSLADVPLGAFLSGGVDSSVIVALMQQQARQPVQTFTIGFEEAGFDEAPYAHAVAKHLGTDHHEMRVTSQQAREVIHALPHMYDEPFADSSQIPTHLVCRAARQHVTVALSGDAGDELFGGYNRYFWGPRIWQRIAWMPSAVRQRLGAWVSAVPIASWDRWGKPLNSLAGAGGVVRLGEKLHKLAYRLHSVHNMDELYLKLVSEWQDPAALVRGAAGGAVGEPASLLNDPWPAQGCNQDALRMMYRDSMTYLPDDILCKVDRAAMATSLETRAPFLDHRVAELAWRMPLDMKIRGNEGKWALRQVLYKHVPRELIERPKAGFSIPIGQWLCGPLRDWAEALLDASRLEAEGYFHAGPIRQRWAEHISGQCDHTHSLWAVLMFQAWLQASETPAC